MDPLGADDLILAYALVQALVALLAIRFLDLYEREPLGLVAVMFLWGAIGAALLASVGNDAVANWLPRDVETVYGPAISAPVVEELAKGVALIAAFALSRWARNRFGVLEFDGVTDGIVYGAAIGIGFAFTEDLYYFFQEARANGVGDALDVFVDRRDFFGPAMLRHAIWTATFGAGLGLATHARRWWGQVGWPFLGLALAMLMHAVNNGLVEVLLALDYGFETTYEYLAIGVPRGLAERMDDSAAGAESALEWISWGYVALFFAAIVLWLLHQRRVIVAELAGEVQAGAITAEEASVAASPARRVRYEFAQLRAGDLDAARATSALCRELAELAFAKRREAGGADTARELARRRERVRSLRP